MKKKIAYSVSLIGLTIALFAVPGLASPLTLKIQTGNPTGAGGYGSSVKVYFRFIDGNGKSQDCEASLKDADLSNSVLSEIKINVSCSTFGTQLESIVVRNSSGALDGAWYCNTIEVIFNEIPRVSKTSVSFPINRWFDNNGNASSFEGVFYNSRYQKPNPRPTQTPKPVELTTSSDTPSANPTGWTECAVEGALCAFEGVKLVSYGANRNWVHKSLPGAVECRNNTFGDAAPGIVKKCYLKSVKPQPTPQPTPLSTPLPKPLPTPQTNPSVVIPGPLVVDANGEHALIQAVRSNDPARVNKVLIGWRNQGTNLVNFANNVRGDTAVTVAADTRKPEILMILLSNGGDVNVAVSRLVTVGDVQTLKTVAAKYPVNITREMFNSALTRQLYGLAQFGLQHGVDANYALQSVITKNIRQMIEPALIAGANADPALKFGMERGDFAIANLALERYNASPDLGLSLAIPKNNLPIVQLALSRGANPTKGIPVAVKGGNVAIITALLDGGGDANTGLMPAVESNRRPVIELLIIRGANPTPAMPFAVRSNDLPLLNFLLEKGAIATAPELIAAAVSNSNLQIAEALLAKGADPTNGMGSAISANNLVMTKFLLDRNARATDQQFILKAAQSGAVGIVNLLLERGANPNDGLAGAIEGGQVVLVDLMIKKGASVKDPSLMSRAGSAGNPDVIKRLLDAGASAESGMSAAVDTALGSKKEISGFDPIKVLEMLIAAGAKAESPDYIIKACSTANTPLATLLLNHNAPKNAVDNLGQPLIQIAALTFNSQIVTAILALGVDPNAKNRAGETALHIVARDEASDGYPKFKKKKKERLPTLNALIAGKADVNIANAKGEFVLKVADGGDVKDILKAAGALKDQKELDKRAPK